MDTNDQSITIIKTFNAPIEKVWRAWTTPAYFAAWFGKPNNVPLDSVQVDVKAGGRWKASIVTPQATMPFTGTYRVVQPPTKLVLVMENAINPQDPNVETISVDLKNLGNGTCEMNFTQEGHLPAEEYQKGLKDGWMGFFDALEDSLKNN